MNTDVESDAQTVNRHLLENQTFLDTENQRLQKNVVKLSKHLEDLRKNTIDPLIFDQLVKEKNHLTALNECLKQKISFIESSVPELSKADLEKQRCEKQEVMKSIEELDIILKKINGRPETFEISVPKESTIKELCHTLTKRLEEEQNRSDQAIETIRRLRDDDEKPLLKDKIIDLKHVITELELENTKLKFEVDQTSEDLERYKNNHEQTNKELSTTRKEKYDLEEQLDKLKQRISDLENEKLKLKREMIEEVTEANRAKRVSAETEIALQHISDAFENKRKEVAKLQAQLEEANSIINAFKDQFEVKD